MRKRIREEEYDQIAWNVKNRRTGQVFTTSGRTPLDARKRLMADQPLLAQQVSSMLDLAVWPFGSADPDISPPKQMPTGTPPPTFQPPPGSPNKFPRAKRQMMAASGDDDSGRSARQIQPTVQMRTGASKGIRGETTGVAAMGANGPSGRDPRREAVRKAVMDMIREVVRKKKGGGGYALYAPNKGKKRSPKPVGEFPTRLAAKNAELARFPPKDPEQLKKMRSRLDKLKKDPKKRAEAEKRDLSGGHKPPKRSGSPSRDRKKRKEELVRLMARDLHERLFHEDEVPGSPWDEHMTSLHPDAISSDRKLSALHRGMEKASIGALGDAHRGLAKVLRGIVKVHPGDISFDGDRKKTFMPITLNCDGMEIGPVHLYIDGGHVKIELSGEAREAIAQLEPDVARDLRGGLMSFEEDHLPGIDGAQRAWRDRDNYLDRLHGKLEKHAAGLSGVEHHILKGLLGKKGKGGRK